jgi:hypothetical protein
MKQQRITLKGNNSRFSKFCLNFQECTQEDHLAERVGANRHREYHPAVSESGDTNTGYIILVLGLQQSI